MLTRSRGATLTTIGLYHYPAAITNSKIATAFLQFGVASGFSSAGSVGGVMNNISGRQQVYFTFWPETSANCGRWFFSLSLQRSGVLPQSLYSMLGFTGQLADFVRTHIFRIKDNTDD